MKELAIPILAFTAHSSTFIQSRACKSRQRKAARRGMSSTSMCSFEACAPSPAHPNPSRVGIPIAAVKEPSLPPPVDPSPKSMPAAAAAAWAFWYSRTTASVRSSGGRFRPPQISSVQRGSEGRKPWTCSSIRRPSATVATRKSTSASAWSGTTLEAVPPLIVPTLTVMLRRWSVNSWS